MITKRLGKLSPRDNAHQLQRITRHTNFVSFSKYLTIGLAVSLVISVFVIPALHQDSGGERLVFSNMPTTESAEPHMTKPHFQSEDNKGQPYRITADTAQQITEGQIQMVKVKADISLNSGKWLALEGLSAFYNQKQDLLYFPQEVDVFYDNGYEINAKNVHIQLEHMIASSEQPVFIHGESGSLKADNFISYTQEGRTLFKKNVKATLYPSTKKK